MNQENDRRSPTRQYPPFYERIVPIALGTIALAIVVLVLVIIGVALGLYPGAR